MSQLLFDTSIVNLLNLHILPTNKFKTTTMIVHIEQDLKEETVTRTALLPHILKRGCAKYPSTQQLRQYTDQLFGAVFHADVVKKARESSCLTVVTVPYGGTYQIEVTEGAETHSPNPSEVTEDFNNPSAWVYVDAG